MESFFRYFARRHKLANLIVVMILVIGLSSLFNANRSVLPSVDMGQMVINTYFPGAAPEDVELNVTNKIEKELKTVIGIDRMTSVSMEDVSEVSIRFDSDAPDIDKVKNDIREAVGRVTDLPPEVTSSPYIYEINTAMMAVIEVGLHGDLPYQRLKDITRQFKKKLLNIPGVAVVEDYGYRAREIQIAVSPEKLQKYQIPIQDITRAIQARNIQATGGSLESYTSEKKVVTLAQFRNPMEVGEVIVRSSFDGPLIMVNDLADIRDTFEKEDEIMRINGKKTISLVVRKSEHGDIIRIVESVRRLAAEEQAALGDQVEFLFASDEAKDVRNQFGVVTSNLVIGLILVTIVLTLFLNLRSSFWVAMGIPLSLLAVVMVLPLFGVNLDVITLSTMILVIGIIVDDGIIITENIYRRYELGDSPLDAAVNGMNGVFYPVLTTILTTILTFAPMFFMPGMLGKFMFVVPLTVTLALSISLVEAMVALPAHMVPSLKNVSREKASFSGRWFVYLKSKFSLLIKKIIKWRYIAVLMTLVMISMAFYYAGNFMDFVMYPTKGVKVVEMVIEMPVGTSLQATADKVSEIEKLIAELPENEVESFSSHTGASDKEYKAYFALDFKSLNERSRTTDIIMSDLRSKIENLGGYEKLNIAFRGGPPSDRPIVIRIVGPDDYLRKTISDSVEDYLGTLPGVIDIERDDPPGKDQVEIKVDYQKLARLGLTVNDIAGNVRIAIDGQIVTDARYGEEDVNFRLKLSDNNQDDLTFLEDLPVPNQQGRLIPLKQIGQLIQGPGPSSIQHYEGERSITISADVESDKNTAVNVIKTVKQHFDFENKYPQMRFIVGGEAEEAEETMHSFSIMFGIAFLAIYFLLILLFDSFFQPLFVLVAVPFGIFGVIVAFALHGEPMSFAMLIGVLGLVGVVVNDSLVLVDHVNKVVARNEDKEMIDRIVIGAADRFRAIILTTVTTVFGLLPLAYGFGGESITWAPMALALGFGLVFSTPLTLLIVPCLYMIGFDVTTTLTRIKDRFKR